MMSKITDELQAKIEKLEKSVIMHHRRMQQLRHSLLLILEATLNWKDDEDE